MAVFRENPFAGRTSGIVLALTVATSLCAAIAAAPSASASKSNASALAPSPKAIEIEAMTGLRPFGRGPAIRVGRAYDVEDEDCTIALRVIADKNGRVHVQRDVACAN
jgi:hypothetical protein